MGAAAWAEGHARQRGGWRLVKHVWKRRCVIRTVARRPQACSKPSQVKPPQAKPPRTGSRNDYISKYPLQSLP
eukprot:2109358-Prymnesium_polylepis.1